MNNLFSHQQKPTVSFDNLMSKMAQLTDEQLNDITIKARQLGISESQISQGLQTIKNIKNWFSNR